MFIVWCSTVAADVKEFNLSMPANGFMLYIKHESPCLTTFPNMHWEESWKYHAQRKIFNELWGVWNVLKQSWVLDTSSQNGQIKS